MQNDENDDAALVAKWLHDNGITSQEFQKDPNKWLELAIRAIKSEKQTVNEAGTIGGSGTASIKGYFAGRIREPKRRRLIKKSKGNQ